MPTTEPERHVKASPLATAALIVGTCLSVATTCGPNAAFSCSRVRKKSARSRSSMFT